MIRSLLVSQKVELKEYPNEKQFDLFGEVTLSEPDGSIRIEEWAFQIKSAGIYSLSKLISDYRNVISQNKADIFTFVVGGSITQTAVEAISKFDRVRIWDAGTICHMLAKAPEIAQKYFGVRGKAFQLDLLPSITNRSQGYNVRFGVVAPGRKHFRDFEDLCIEALKELFCPPLGQPKIQLRTADGLDVRDALFPNHAEDGVWHRIRQLVYHNFVVFEFKNWNKPVNQKAIDQCIRYSGRKSIGKLCIIISRKGISKNGKKAQAIAYRDFETIIIVITDDQLIEMLNRKENNEEPAAVTEDIIEEFMMQY